jgi:hypothetical protein
MAYDVPVQTPNQGAARGLMALVRRQLHVVGRLAGKAVAMARSLKAEWSAPSAREGSNEPPRDIGWLAGACAKISRALRMIVLLKARLIAEQRSLDEAEDFEGPWFEAGPPCFTDDAWRADLARDLFQGLAQDSAKAAEQPERQRRIREPRKVDPLHQYVMTRPVEALIEEICEDLGLGPDWLQQVEQEWELAEAGEPDRAPEPPVVPKSSSSRALCPGPMSTADPNRAERAPQPP